MKLIITKRILDITNCPQLETSTNYKYNCILKLVNLIHANDPASYILSSKFITIITIIIFIIIIITIIITNIRLYLSRYMDLRKIICVSSLCLCEQREFTPFRSSASSSSSQYVLMFCKSIRSFFLMLLTLFTSVIFLSMASQRRQLRQFLYYIILHIYTQLHSFHFNWSIFKFIISIIHCPLLTVT